MFEFKIFNSRPPTRQVPGPALLAVVGDGVAVRRARRAHHFHEEPRVVLRAVVGERRGQRRHGDRLQRVLPRHVEGQRAGNS